MALNQNCTPDITKCQSWFTMFDRRAKDYVKTQLTKGSRMSWTICARLRHSVFWQNFQRNGKIYRNTVSFWTALTWTLVFSLWNEIKVHPEASTLQCSRCFAPFSIVYRKTCFGVCFCSSYNVFILWNMQFPWSYLW